MKKKITGLSLFLAVLITVPAVFAEESQVVKHEEFAKELSDKLDLSVEAVNKTPKETFQKLQGAGIVPDGGWGEGKALTKKELQDVLSRAARLGKDESLGSRGIILPQGGSDYVDKNALSKVFEDQATKQVLAARAASLSGPSMPFPKENSERTEIDIKELPAGDIAPVTTPSVVPVDIEPPTLPTIPPPPPTTEPPTQPPTGDPPTEPPTEPPTGDPPPISDR